MQVSLKYPLTIAFFLAVGCGPIGNAVKTIKGQGQTPVETDFATTDAAGTWKVSCTPTQFLQGNYQASATLVISSAGALTRDVTYWSDSACTASTFAVHQTANITIGGSLDGDHRSLAVTGLKTVDTPSTADMTTALNASGAICGSKNWTAGSPNDVSSTACNTLSSSGITTVNAIQIILSASPHLLSLMQQSGNSFGMGFLDQYTEAQ
jgi:hypothetical protein